uniref:PRLI-interacting factor A n=1 Tax=Davidia involucrata TaxID=16924 RepID=A0A5B7AH28_DAVIN
MNDQPHMMNQSQLINQSQMMSQPQVMMNQPQVMNQSQLLSQRQLMNQNAQMLNQPQGMSQPQMLSRSYGMWPPQISMDPMKFPNPMKQGSFATKQSKPPGRSNWKGKKGNDMRNDGRRKEKPVIAGSGSGAGVVAAGGGGSGGGNVGYKPPTLTELQHQNRLKARKFYPKKKFNRFAPFAPRNTTSFLIRAKKSGGIASLVSPCPVTPAVLPTPIFSPSREVLVDMAKEEWGVDGYGSMKGLIRLRSPGNEADAHEEDEEDEGGSSESDVEEHVEVERRLDHDLSRFEMIYPNCGADYNNVLENRVDDQDTHIAQLEEENLILKERLFLMDRELGDLRRRLQCLERQNQAVEEINEEVVENVSENGSEGEGDVRSTEENNEEVVEENNEGGEYVKAKEENNDDAPENEGVADVCMKEFAHAQDAVVAENQYEGTENQSSKDEGAGNGCSEKSIDGGDLSNCPALM